MFQLLNGSQGCFTAEIGYCYLSVRTFNTFDFNYTCYSFIEEDIYEHVLSISTERVVRFEPVQSCRLTRVNQAISSFRLKKTRSRIESISNENVDDHQDLSSSSRVSIVSSNSDQLINQGSQQSDVKIKYIVLRVEST